MKLARFLHDGVTHIGVVNKAASSSTSRAIVSLPR